MTENKKRRRADWKSSWGWKDQLLLFVRKSS